MNPQRTYRQIVLLEYEQWMPQMRAGVEVQFATLEKLREFTGSTRNDGRGFLTAFAIPYEEIVLKISKSISNAG
jgi:hypothetical protein